MAGLAGGLFGVQVRDTHQPISSMLKQVSRIQVRFQGARFAIVASRYNARFVDSMLRAARAELRQAKARSVRVVRVPGAFEIPVVASVLARSKGLRPDALICLGVILRGQTHHAQAISDAVTAELARIQTDQRLPVIHEVLLLESEEQARQRCLDPRHNRGLEAARTAIEMARLMGELSRGERRA
jgi:6,7-dimethyl-8-ribityllumazine synthase